MIKAIILDFDDTLCLTEESCFYLENETLRRLGRPAMSRELHKKNWGVGLFTAITERSPGIDVEQFRLVYEKVLPEFIASGRLDNIPESNLNTIDQLLEEKYKILILTSREHSELKHILEPSHDLYSRVEAFYYKDNMQYHKPDPRAFQQIEQDHGWKPNECVYVGDSIGDAQAAKGAHLHFIASLESGLRQKIDFEHEDVDVFINHFTDLPQAIRKLK